MSYRGQRGGAPQRGGGNARGGGQRGGGFQSRGGGNQRGGGIQHTPGRVHGDGRSALLNREVRALEDSTLAPSLEDPVQALSLSSDTVLPVRPAYSNKGREIIVWANYIEVTVKKPKTFDWYSIAVLATGLGNDGKAREPPTGKKLQRIVQLLLKQLPDSIQLATDGKAILLSTEPLGFSDKEFVVHYFAETEAQATDKSPKYRVKLKWTRHLDFTEIYRYLKSPNMSEPAPVSKAEMLQALNIIFAHGMKQNPGIVTKNSKHYPVQLPNASATLISRQNLADGLEALRGFYMSVRPATGRLLLDIQVTNGAFWKSAPLIQVLPLFGDPVRANRALKGVWVLVAHLGNKPKRITSFVTGEENISPDTKTPAGPVPNNPRWGVPSKVRFFKADKASSGQMVGKYVTVAQYFKETYSKDCFNSNWPVVNVGTKDRPVFLPAEACTVKPMQSYDRKLSPAATAQMIKFAVRPAEINADDINDHGFELLRTNAKESTQAFALGVNAGLVTVNARVLDGPPLQYLDAQGRPKILRSADGQWNMRNIKFTKGTALRNWAYMRITIEGGNEYLNTEGENATHYTIAAAMRAFVQIMKSSGINAEQPTDAGVLRLRSADAAVHDVPRFFQAKFAKPPNMLFVLLPGDHAAVYNAVKKAGDIDFGIHTVNAHTVKFAKIQRSEQFHANVALKVNLKLGGQNQTLSPQNLPIVSAGSTMLVGLDVTHPAPGSASNAPSVSAIVASIDKNLAQWPADVAIQKGRKEMVEGLQAMFVGRLRLWQKHNAQKLPEQVIVYRDGVGDTMYDLVLEQELPLIREACKSVYPGTDTAKGLPRLSIIICGKRHKTRFYPASAQEADPKTGGTKAGTVVDRGVTETRVWDSFIQAHTALHGTPRPAHYVVVHDEILRRNAQLARTHGQGAANDLISLSFSLSYLHGRATKAVSLCTPAYYADMVCDRARRWLVRVFDQEASSNSAGGEAKSSEVTVHPRLKDSMFYI